MRKFLSLAAVAALALFVTASLTHVAKAAEGSGGVKVTVKDDAGKAVANAKVELRSAREGRKPRAKTTAAEDKPDAKGKGRPAAVASGTTADDGTVTLSDVPAGSYTVMAMMKGAGTGRANVIVSAGSTADVSIVLKAHGKQAAGAK